MRIGANTDIGRVREENEDIYLIKEEDPNYKLFVVCDGMGGHKAGKVASTMTVELINKYFDEKVNNVSFDQESILEVLIDSIKVANSTVYKKSEEDPECYGMGSTIVAGLAYENKVYIAHAGDSRAYVIKQNQIERLTHDHSYVEELVENGTITKEEADIHPRRNVITRAVGNEENIEVEINTFDLDTKAIILLCTDGLTSMVKDEEIFEIINDHPDSPQDACDALIEKANALGGNDNITCIVIYN